MQTKSKINITSDMVTKAENQIETEKRNVDYDTREFTIEYIVDKYLKDEERDANEIYVPEYQREFVWDDYRQSRFIESIILGLPIPLIFVAEIHDSGRLEIVDGSQRVRTLAAFLNGKLRLRGLSKLSNLNNFHFSNFSSPRQRKFKNTPIRMIVLSSKASEEVRNDMFDRINTSSLPLHPMETRKGIFRGGFNNFVFECAQNEKFKKLSPIGFHFVDRQEEAELALRFFAFSETYPDFSFNNNESSLEQNGVARFLDRYMDYKNKNATATELIEKKRIFLQTLDFVEKTFPYGFAKYRDSKETSRPYFEAIAVGSYLALKENPSLNVKSTQWTHLDKNNQGEFFVILSGRYHTHKPDRLRQRIDFVRNKLLGKK